MKPFNFVLTSNNQPSPAIPFSDTVYRRELDAGVAKSIVVPAGAKIVVFASNDAFFASNEPIAAVPSGDLDAGPEFVPSVREVSEGEFIHLIAEEAAVVTMSFFGA